ncbi:hypothetical protein FQR65_LT17656 [Abscondita terminalis]|nr:hypothetical protein FQR65_LT17656 [Abscondita terminalis]
MARTAEGLTKAKGFESRSLKKNSGLMLTVLGENEELNLSLEKAGRVADFIELGELMVDDAFNRSESCGGHFRLESQTEEGEAKRNDEEFTYVSAWEFKGENQPEQESFLNNSFALYKDKQLVTQYGKYTYPSTDNKFPDKVGKFIEIDEPGDYFHLMYRPDSHYDTGQMIHALRNAFNRISTSFIEQIDSLSHIASEFSAFAKLPDTRTNTQAKIIVTNHADSNEIFVLGDKDQLLRTFNNLIKNAIEAGLGRRKLKIDFDIYANPNEMVEKYISQIMETGISDEHYQDFPANLQPRVQEPAWVSLYR